MIASAYSINGNKVDKPIIKLKNTLKKSIEMMEQDHDCFPLVIGKHFALVGKFDGKKYDRWLIHKIE